MKKGNGILKDCMQLVGILLYPVFAFMFLVGMMQLTTGCANKLTSISFKADNNSSNSVTINAPGATLSFVTEQKNSPVVVPDFSALKDFVPGISAIPDLSGLKDILPSTPVTPEPALPDLPANPSEPTL